MKKIRFVEGMLEHLRQMREEKKILFLQNGAELYIAKAFRAFKLRRKLKHLIYWNRYAKAIVIQRVYRGYRARLRCTLLGKQNRARAKLENESAVQLQKIVRSFIARCRFQHILEKREIRLQQLYEKKKKFLAEVSNLSFSYFWIY